MNNILPLIMNMINEVAKHPWWIVAIVILFYILKVIMSVPKPGSEVTQEEKGKVFKEENLNISNEKQEEARKPEDILK